MLVVGTGIVKEPNQKFMDRTIQTNDLLTNLAEHHTGAELQ